MKSFSYEKSNGKIISNHDLKIHRFKDARFLLKVTDTSVFELIVDWHYAIKDISNRTYATCIKMKSKIRITDSKSRTGDRLREVIPMQRLKPCSILVIECGDGVIVVPFPKKGREGSQESSINNNSSGVNSRRSPLLKSNLGGYNP